MVIQVVGVQFAGAAIAVNKDGITGWQWAVCLIFGAGELVWQQVINAVHECTRSSSSAKIADEEAGSRGIKTAGILKFGKGKVALASSVRDQSRSRRIVASSRRPGLKERVASTRSKRVESKYGAEKTVSSSSLDVELTSPKTK